MFPVSGPSQDSEAKETFPEVQISLREFSQRQSPSLRRDGGQILRHRECRNSLMAVLPPTSSPADSHRIAPTLPWPFLPPGLLELCVN